jgi:hypothetical protein
MTPSPAKIIDPEWAARMADMTQLANSVFTALTTWADTLPPDEALAWITGLRGDPRYHWSEPTRIAIERARNAGLIGREIAQITEGTDDPTVANRVMMKQAWRNRAKVDFDAGVGEFQVDPGGMPSI